MRFKRTSLIMGTATAGVLALATSGVAGAAAGQVPAAGSDSPTASSTSSDSPTSEPAPQPTNPQPTTGRPEPTSSSHPKPTDSNGGSARGASLSVSPGTARPGQHLAVRLSCLGDRGTPHSAALRMGRSEGAAGSVYTNATVASSAGPGTHTVSATCAGKTLTATFTVPGSKAPQRPAQPPQVRHVPKGSVDTGDGSLAAQR